MTYITSRRKYTPVGHGLLPISIPQVGLVHHMIPAPMLIATFADSISMS